MFSTARDALAGRAIKTWANALIARYGRLQDFKIDSDRKTVCFSLVLDGELSPIAISIDNYVVEDAPDGKYLRATRFTCTRPWLQNLLTDHGPKQRIKLPAWASAAF